jgi:adenylate cyclase
VARVRFVDGPTIELEEGESLLDGSTRYGLDHMHACGGKCRCSTCRIEVLEGGEHLPDPSEEEAEVLELNSLLPPIRLACQLRPRGDLVVRVLLHESEFPPAPSLAEGLAQERDVAVLFSDIRGFTSFAEERLPFDVLHLLNRYFDRMGGLVEKHQGHVVSFQGDGMLALFLASGDRSAMAAVASGLDMLNACQSLSAYASQHFGIQVAVGIGIDFGRAVVGQVGYYRKTELSAIGDVVNTASRVRVLTKETGVPLLVTEAVRSRVADHFEVGRDFAGDLRGKAGRHRLYEVTGKPAG